MSRLLREAPVAVAVHADRRPAAADPAPVASVRDLEVGFTREGQRIRALRGVSLDIAPGEIVALVGESGSGKSVLGLSLLGLLPPASAPVVSGTVEVCGVDVVGAPQRRIQALRRDHLGAVFQDPMTSLNPTMRIGRQVVEAAGSEAAALELLDAAGLPDARSRLRAYPHELSGGQRQRVMIAMAIAGSPRLVVADEPTTALDVTVQAQILRLLAELRDRTACSFVFITHDLGVAAELADRVVVMYAGRLVEVGGARDVLERPAHPYAAALGASRLTLRSDRSRPVRSLPGEPPEPQAPDAGCAFTPRCGHGDDRCRAAVPALAPVAGHGGHVACVRPDVALQRAEPLPPWPAPRRVLDSYALEVVGLTRTYPRRGRRSPEVRALDGVDLRVGPGEVVALVGESGSGKSTLLRLVAGLDPATAGQIALPPDGAPQMVFQDAGASLTPWLTIGELVGERLRATGTARGDLRARVGEALQLVGLPTSVLDVVPAALSGGQRQRAALARAIVVPPKLLLCDEPTSALDTSLAATMLNALGDLRRQLGMAMLFVTHDLAVARLVADRIVVMHRGRIVEQLPADDLETATDPYTCALLDAVPGHGRPGHPTAPARSTSPEA